MRPLIAAALVCSLLGVVTPASAYGSRGGTGSNHGSGSGSSGSGDDSWSSGGDDSWSSGSSDSSGSGSGDYSRSGSDKYSRSGSGPTAASPLLSAPTASPTTAAPPPAASASGPAPVAPLPAPGSPASPEEPRLGGNVVMVAHRTGVIRATANSAPTGGSARFGPDLTELDPTLKKAVPTIDGVEGAASPAQRAAELLRRGQSRLAMGDHDGALRAATAALEFNPASAAALVLRSQAHARAGRADEALADAERAVALKPDSAPAWETLAWNRLRRRDAEGAKQAADRALELAPNSPLALATRAYAHQLLGNRDAMRRDIAAAAALDGRFAGQAAKAAAGEDIYDPAADSSALLDAAAHTPGRDASKALPPALAALGAAALLGGFLIARARRKLPPPQRASDGLLGGKYRLDKIIGSGGMGEVYLAQDTSLGRPVAVKVVSSQLDDSASWRDIMRKEALAVAGAHHPGIVEIYELVEADGELYLVFEYLEGKTVAQLISERQRLPPEEVARILIAMCEPLEFAHQRGLIHRDIKPGNIMLLPTGHVKLMDFGIARAAGARAAALTGARAPAPFERTMTVAGTPLYMSPEAEQGLVGRAGDIFSLGVCLYEMLVGRRPWNGSATLFDKATPPPRPSDWVPELPPRYDALVAAALAFDPAKRPPSAAAFAAALRG